MFSVTSDLAASAPYSSAPPKFAPPDPSQANDNFAALVDSNNTQADTASSLPPAPEPAAPQRSSNDSSQTSANRPSSDAGAANPAPPPANSNNTTDSATQAAEDREGQSLAIERELQQLLFQSDDAKEGIAAYTEKRKAEFKGQ